ncbi:MAG: DUF1569 domain-containing protein [Bacteroidetes bacterium]|nr:MAG: DUF1569 domain-containing protein [Bacteroidota bacterium]
MEFIEPKLEQALIYLERLEPETKALWGTMNAQRMVEHLTDAIRMAQGKGDYKLEIPEDKVAKAQAFLISDYPMPRNFQASFAPIEYSLRNEEMALAIDEFVQEWLSFEEYYQEEEGRTNLHPNFGILNYEQWLRLHAKHLTHHFQQFALIPES